MQFERSTAWKPSMLKSKTCLMGRRDSSSSANVVVANRICEDNATAIAVAVLPPRSIFTLRLHEFDFWMDKLKRRDVTRRCRFGENRQQSLTQKTSGRSAIARDTRSKNTGSKNTGSQNTGSQNFHV